MNANATRRPVFADLLSQPALLASVAKLGYSLPTDVQIAAIPLIVAGHDALVQSSTGTGKTLAFVLPTLERLESGAAAPRILVIAPTRELALQVGAVYVRLSKAVNCGVAVLTGGAGYGEQLRALAGGAAVVVGTPGRLNDHLDRGTLDLSGCTTVVLDEADEMLDMGFQDELDALLAALPDARQTLLFSATISDGVERIARGKMRTPRRVGVAGLEASATLTHVVYEVAQDAKFHALANLLHVERPEQAIVFCHTKADTETLHKRLVAEGFPAAFLNGDLPQHRRTETLDAFRAGKLEILVATDVAARGIDVRGITHAINFDIPKDGENYVHRAGRTGRAGSPGMVINLAMPMDRGKIRRLGQQANIAFETRLVPSAEQVQARLRERFYEKLAVRLEDTVPGRFASFAADLLANFEAADLVEALLEDLQKATRRLEGGYTVEAIAARPAERASGRREAPRRAERERKPRAQEAGMVRLRVNLGKADRIMPGHLVAMICKRSGIEGRSLGAISIFPRHSFVDVDERVAGRVAPILNDLLPAGRR